MRTSNLIVLVTALTVSISASMFASALPASAAALSRQDAVSRVQADGFALVSKAEEAPGSWDVWASKDGIAYEVKINAQDGSMIVAVPVEAND